MKLATLQRISENGREVIGEMRVGEHFRCVTIERPWKNNEPNISCVPAGTYKMSLGVFNRGGYPSYELESVPGRSLIKIHAANRSSELAGCIAPGAYITVIDGDVAVASSRNTLNDFMAAMGGDTEGAIVITN